MSERTQKSQDTTATESQEFKKTNKTDLKEQKSSKNSTGGDLSETGNSNEDANCLSDFPEEELQVLAALWSLAMKADLPPDVERRIAPFRKFQQIPEQSLEIMRSALNSDAELRASMHEKLTEEDSDFLSMLVNFVDEQTRNSAKTSKPEHEPKHNSKELLEKHYPALVNLWLLRPPGWRQELDRLLILHSELRLLEETSTRQRNEIQNVKNSPQKTKDKETKTKKEIEKLRLKLKEEQSGKRMADSQVRKLTDQFADAEELMKQLREDLNTKTDELTSIRRRHEKLQKDLTEKQQNIQRLEKQVRQLTEEQQSKPPPKPKKKRTGYKRKNHPIIDNASSEPRHPIAPPKGTGSFSETSAFHYMHQTTIVIIDGYNFIYCGWQEETQDLHAHFENGEQRSKSSDSAHQTGLEVFRNRLIDNCLQAFAAYKSYKLERISIIFDGKYPAPATSYPPQSGVQVIFTKNGAIADDEIVDRIQQYPATKAIVVVTDDNELRNRCKEHGATIMSVTQLLRIFQQKH